MQTCAHLRSQPDSFYPGQDLSFSDSCCSFTTSGNFWKQVYFRARLRIMVPCRISLRKMLSSFKGVVVWLWIQQGEYKWRATCVTCSKWWNLAILVMVLLLLMLYFFFLLILCTCYIHYSYQYWKKRARMTKDPCIPFRSWHFQIIHNNHK